MIKQDVELLITDLDDTIWDWITMWYNSFHPYLKRISEALNIDEELLKQKFKALHKKYHTSECSFAYKELGLNDIPYSELIKIFEEDYSRSDKSIIYQYNLNLKNNLKLYPNVLDTLKYIKKMGTTIIGFTESQSFYVKMRLKYLELDGIFDAIYTPESLDFQGAVNSYYEKDYWEPEKTIIKTLPTTTKKPNPKLLSKIILDACGNHSKTIYIGDHLRKDVHMANEAGITSVHAKYSSPSTKTSYNLLREVSHWTDKEIEEEKRINEIASQLNISALYKLDISFNELLNLFNFVPNYITTVY